MFLSSLLKAIEETNGGTLLHLLGQQEKERSGQQMASNIGESKSVRMEACHSNANPKNKFFSTKSQISRVRVNFFS